MKAAVQMNRGQSQGMFGSREQFRVSIQLHLEGDERSLIEEFRPYSPDPLETFDIREDDKVDVHKALRKRGGDSLLGYVQGVTMEFETLQLAGKYEDAVLEAFRTYRGQIDITRVRAGKLGEARELEI